MKKITEEELQEILRKHQLWLDNNKDGERADLSNTDLYDADLDITDLCWADLCWADLRRANLSITILNNANLHNANLSHANLNNADLYGANLSYIKYNNDTSYIQLQCPQEGSFIGYKKAHNCIIKLQILEDSKRSSAATRKCRCDKAKVLSITGIDTGKEVDSIPSNHDSEFIYKVNEIVSVDNFDEDRWIECAAGIHFFMDKQEALNYV